MSTLKFTFDHSKNNFLESLDITPMQFKDLVDRFNSTVKGLRSNSSATKSTLVEIISKSFTTDELSLLLIDQIEQVHELGKLVETS